MKWRTSSAVLTQHLPPGSAARDPTGHTSAGELLSTRLRQHHDATGLLDLGIIDVVGGLRRQIPTQHRRLRHARMLRPDKRSHERSQRRVGSPLTTREEVTDITERNWTRWTADSFHRPSGQRGHVGYHRTR
jgi:hypothetical protein